MDNSLGNKEIMAKNIVRYMQGKGVNRADFCRDLGFNYNTVSDWIHARKYPRIDKIEAMARYFGVTKADLVEPPPAPAVQEGSGFTARDERDIKKRLDAIRDDLANADGLAFMGGEKMTEDDRALMLDAIESGLRTAKRLAKKYTPKKYLEDGK